MTARFFEFLRDRIATATRSAGAAAATMKTGGTTRGLESSVGAPSDVHGPALAQDRFRANLQLCVGEARNIGAWL